MREIAESGLSFWPIDPKFTEVQNYHAPYNGSNPCEWRASHSGEWQPGERRDEKMEQRALEFVMNMCPQLSREAAAVDLKNLLESHPYNEAINLLLDRFCNAGLPETSENHIYDAISKVNQGPAGNRIHKAREVTIVDNGFSDCSEHQACSSKGTATSTKGKEVIDLTLDSDEDNEEILYREWCMYRLAEDFPRASLSSLREALMHFGGKLNQTYRDVSSRYQLATNLKGAGNSLNQVSLDGHRLSRVKLTLLDEDRAPRPAPSRECPRFEKEWSQLEVLFQSKPKKLLADSPARASDIASEPIPSNPVEDLDKYWDEVEEQVRVEIRRTVPPEETLEECGCCCSELPFNKFVQCADGHLFCTDCLRRHVEGMIFGASQTCGLPLCMETQGCDKTFPWSEVQKALPTAVCSKYEQRLAEYEVARAKIDGLVYCPFCNYPWEVDPGMVVLRCLNETCKKASCIKCKEPHHLPKDCAEVEKESETAMRKKVEEQMSKALIRVCMKCRAELVKTDGCNKITCPCGQMMCYLCRKAISDYYHFCQHARKPGLPCSECSGCLLWEVEDEFEKVKVAKRAAIEEVTQQGAGLLKRDIGPSEYNDHHKRPRTDEWQ